MTSFKMLEVKKVQACNMHVVQIARCNECI